MADDIAGMGEKRWDRKGRLQSLPSTKNTRVISLQPKQVDLQNTHTTMQGGPHNGSLAPPAYRGRCSVQLSNWK